MSAILDWIRAHTQLDVLLAFAGGVFALAVVAASIAVVGYSALFLLRLFQPENIKEFLKRPFPAARSLKVLGQKIDFADSARADEKLWTKIRQVSAAVEKIEEQSEIFEEALTYLFDSAGTRRGK